MKIEIVEFYLDKFNHQKKSLTGSLHIYICDMKVDLRGVDVVKNSTGWHFYLPRKVGKLEGKRVFYPTFTFSDPKLNQSLRDQVFKLGQAYIENFLQGLKPDGKK